MSTMLGVGKGQRIRLTEDKTVELEDGKENVKLVNGEELEIVSREFLASDNYVLAKVLGKLSGCEGKTVRLPNFTQWEDPNPPLLADKT